MILSRALIPLALAAVLAGCSMGKLGPYRIDVQQGNAIDAESVARLKPGLSRTQVRFLMGTPLVVDPFHNDRWDYIYELRKSGALTEQKRVTLIFDGDVLARIEGDVPANVASGAAPPEETRPATDTAVPDATAAEAAHTVAADSATDPAATSIVAPLDPPPPAEPAPPQTLPDAPLAADTAVETIEPDPGFPESETAAAEPVSATGTEAAVVDALDQWAAAWRGRDQDAYLAAYSRNFLPQGGGSRADWEKRRRLLLGAAQNIELRIETPRVTLAADGSATVTFNQYYRSDSYRDAVAKQMRLVNEKGRWLIVQERVLNILNPSRKLR